jgi:hypothetical protein
MFLTMVAHGINSPITQGAARHAVPAAGRHGGRA